MCQISQQNVFNNNDGIKRVQPSENNGCTLSSLKSRVPGLGCLPFMQEVKGSTPTGGTCHNDFFNPTDQDIRTQCVLSWPKVVSEWRLVIAMSLNIGGGVHLVKPALQNNEEGHTAPGVCGHGSILLSHLGNVVTRSGL